VQWSIAARRCYEEGMQSVRADERVWLMVKPSASLPGTWVAHVLDVDIVTQGDSLGDAIEMAVDAYVMALLDDLTKGRDPRARRRAPPECWEELEHVMQRGERVEGAEAGLDVPAERAECVVAQLAVRVTQAERSAAPEPRYRVPLTVSRRSAVDAYASAPPAP
jgi:hypothetical protein